MIRVWDPLVRVFHWALGAAVAIAWITAESSAAVHVRAGYAVAAPRCGWCGASLAPATRASRSSSPDRRLGAYLAAAVRGCEPRYIGHNPAGAVMILPLIPTIGVTAWTGWLMEGAPLPGGQQTASLLAIPARADADAREHAGKRRPEPKQAEEVHEATANLLLVLIALHVACVAWAGIHSGENLVRAMIIGRKRAPGPGEVD